MRSLVAEEGLYMRNGARFQAVDLYGARIGRNINFMRAWFSGRLIMNAVKVGGNLIGFESEFAADVGLKGAAVEGMVDIRRCRFDGRLDMWWLKIGQDLLMGGMHGDDVAREPAKYKLLDCRNAKIGGELNLNHVDIADHLNLSSATITNEALLGHQSHFAGVDLRLARIGQNLNLEEASVAGGFDFTAAEIGGDVVFGNAKFSGEVDLVFARIFGNLDLCDGEFCTIDLTGTSVAGEFRLSDEIEWAAGAELILRNTKVATLHDEPDAWPDDVELDGFVYDGFGGLDADADNDLKRRRSAWFISWLEKDVPHTPQPYRQCAKVLVEMGHPEMADDVLYAGRERGRCELKESGEHMAALGLWFLKITIGYGHGAARYFRTLYWAAGLVALGVVILMMTGDYLLLDGNILWQDATGGERLINVVQAASFSLNKLLPVIELPFHHDRIIFGTAAKLYFQIHKLMGYILALFLLAGITGLTK